MNTNIKRRTKRTIFLILAICMFVGVSQTALAAGTFQTTSRVNLRAEPSTNADIVSVVYLGTNVEVAAHDPSGWSRVQVNGVSGYIRSDFLRFPVGDSPPTFRATAGVNVRSGASTGADIIDSVARGGNVEVLEHVPNAWSRVRVDGTAGFIRSDFLTRSEPGTSIGVGPSAQVASATQAAPTTLRTVGNVNMRSGPSTNYNRIALLAPNTSVEVLAALPSGWSRVNHGGTTGYISSELISAAGAPNQSVVRLYTNTAGVRLRSGPSTNYRIVDSFSVGTAVEVLENRADGWSRVRHGGNTGFIRSDLLGPSTTFQMIEWSEARRIIPTGRNFRVVDVRTGISFNLRAFSIGRHADVEPVTQADTDAILRTRNGNWSWAARPVWVTIGDRTFPASLNGMPHGGGTISGNGINGHFCLWFRGSNSTGSTSVSYRNNMLAAVEEAWRAMQ